MKKNEITSLVIGLLIISSFAFAQVEQRKGVKINKIQNNAGKRWAICIGINDYEDNSIIKLKKARNDAKELGGVLEKNGQFDKVVVMTDDLDPRCEDYPKLINIRNKMNYLKEFIAPQDLVVFSFSGHGVSNVKGEGYLLVTDSQGRNIYSNSLKVSDIIAWIKEVNVKKSLLLLDACREQIQEGKFINLNGLRTERFLQAEVGAVFYSTKSGWFSYEDKNGNFGIFTKYVIAGLMGNADIDNEIGNNDGIVTFSELAAYVDNEVSKWALAENKKQRPATMILGEKFGDLALTVVTNIENIAQIAGEMPADVKAVESIALKIYKNDKGFWEADFGDDILMIYIPAGEFTMGSNFGNLEEKPAHKVYLDGYWMGKNEVTVKQFKVFVNETRYITRVEKEEGEYWRAPNFKQEDNHPVVYILWDDAEEYCKWLSKKIGITFTLPTEAQWEKGARGTDGRKYPWGNHEPDANGKYYANFAPYVKQDIKKGEDGYENTSPVGSYPNGASPYGLLDMAGNVWEWTKDWYATNYYKENPEHNPTGPSTGDFRIVRGGSCLTSFSSDLKCFSRLRDYDIRLRYGEYIASSGFRICAQR